MNWYELIWIDMNIYELLWYMLNHVDTLRVSVMYQWTSQELFILQSFDQNTTAAGSTAAVHHRLPGASSLGKLPVKNRGKIALFHAIWKISVYHWKKKKKNTTSHCKALETLKDLKAVLA